MWNPSFTLSPVLRRIAVFSALSFSVAVAVSACGSFHREQRPAWRDQAEASCLRSGKVRESQYVKISKAIDGPGICGANSPLKVAALATPVAPEYAQSGNLVLTSGNMMLTSITPTATLACPMVSAVDEWLAKDVQTAAMTWFGQPMVELITFGSFACRPMNHRSGARLSEHSFANAIDAKAFKLADGRVISVEKGWRGASDEQGFLREVSYGACNRFSTVLAPGSDALHYNHIHMDLARHNTRGDKHVCRPKLQMPAPPNANYSDPQPMADAPIFKPAPDAQMARAPRRPVPSDTDIGQTGNPDDEVEDIRNEPDFNGKYFDITGSIRNKDDPPVLVQHPGIVRKR